MRTTILDAWMSSYRNSRNLEESNSTKCQRVFWTLWFSIRAIIIGVRMIGKECLGSRVIHEGEERIISNWAGSELPTLCGENGFYRQYVPRNEISNIFDIKEALHRYRFGVSFFCGYWMGIRINEKLYQSQGEKYES